MKNSATYPQGMPSHFSCGSLEILKFRDEQELSTGLRMNNRLMNDSFPSLLKQGRDLVSTKVETETNNFLQS